MHKSANRFIIALVVLFLWNCVTLQDVQRATDLIRTDNELTRLLTEVRPVDPVTAAISLTSLADHAKNQADALKTLKGKESDAIAYYRIASTAYWRSGNPQVVNALFATANDGSDLCMQSGPAAPDRDCLFLRLVIPFAGLEASASRNGLSGLLESVNFNDGGPTPTQIEKMRTIRDALAQARLLVRKILGIGQDDRLLTHETMRQYYCDNANKAFDFYMGLAGVFVAKVSDFQGHFPNRDTDLGITLEEARAIKQMELDVPEFCR